MFFLVACFLIFLVTMIMRFFIGFALGTAIKRHVIKLMFLMVITVIFNECYLMFLVALLFMFLVALLFMFLVALLFSCDVLLDVLKRVEVVTFIHVFDLPI